jgi:hypothetical protein
MLEGGGLECVCASRQAGMKRSLSPGGNAQRSTIGPPKHASLFSTHSPLLLLTGIASTCCKFHARPMQDLPIKKRSSQARASKQASKGASKEQASKQQ